MKTRMLIKRVEHRMQQMLSKRSSKRTTKQTPERPTKPTMKKNSSLDQGLRKVHIKMITSIIRMSRLCCFNNNSWENRYRAIRKAMTQRTKSSEIIWISYERSEIKEDLAFLLSKASRAILRPSLKQIWRVITWQLRERICQPRSCSIKSIIYNFSKIIYQMAKDKTD